MTFEAWVETLGNDVRVLGLKHYSVIGYVVKLDGDGWLAPLWVIVPKEIDTTNEEEKWG